MAFIPYAGKRLASSQQCWWKVRVWDQEGNASEWSQPASWVIGMLAPADWKADWLSAAGAEKFSLTPYGYRAMASQIPTAVKWVQDVPSKKETDVREKGKAASESRGVKFIKYENGNTVYEILSGSYQFETIL